MGLESSSDSLTTSGGEDLQNEVGGAHGQGRGCAGAQEPVRITLASLKDVA